VLVVVVPRLDGSERGIVRRHVTKSAGLRRSSPSSLNRGNSDADRRSIGSSPTAIPPGGAIAALILARYQVALPDACREALPRSLASAAATHRPRRCFGTSARNPSRMRSSPWHETNSFNRQHRPAAKEAARSEHPAATTLNSVPARRQMGRWSWAAAGRFGIPWPPCTRLRGLDREPGRLAMSRRPLSVSR